MMNKKVSEVSDDTNDDISGDESFTESSGSEVDEFGKKDKKGTGRGQGFMRTGSRTRGGRSNSSTVAELEVEVEVGPEAAEIQGQIVVLRRGKYR